MENYSMNPLKQNIKLKQYIGWFIAIFFPFTARAIMDITKVPLFSVLIYWIICGITLRLHFEKKLPYFNPKFKKVKKESILLLLITIFCIYLYLSGDTTIKTPTKELILNIFIFAFLNGSLEHLVWINIFDLAGSRIKLSGYLAAFINVILIYVVFWKTLILVPMSNTLLFIVSQVLILIISFIIYKKTRDITIWALQRILFNLLIVFSTNLGINTFFHI